MKNVFNKMIIWSIINEILFIGFGIFMVVQPKLISKTIGYLMGVLLIIYGLYSIFAFFNNKKTKFFRFELPFGIISLIAGIVVIVDPLSIFNFAALVLGIYMVVASSMKIQYAISLKGFKQEYWSVILGIGIMMLIFGVLLIFNPFASMALAQLIGVFIIIYGVLDLMQTVLFKKNVKTLVKVLK